MNNIYKEHIDIYINNKKIKFNTKYTSDKTGKIKVKIGKLIDSTGTEYNLNTNSAIVPINLTDDDNNYTISYSYLFT